MGEVLPYLMVRFPLWSEKALDPNYKRAFPYVAVSQQQYESWNIGKRINAEVSYTFTIYYIYFLMSNSKRMNSILTRDQENENTILIMFPLYN